MKTVIISILVLCGVIFGSIYFNNHTAQKSLSTKVNTTENINVDKKIKEVSVPTFSFDLCSIFSPNNNFVLREYMENTFSEFGEDKNKDILEIALAHGQKEIVGFLTEQGIKPKGLIAAIALGKKDEVENYLKQGKISNKTIYQCDGECFLKEVEGKQKYVCKENRSRGKEIRTASNLYIAAANNQVEIAKLLLQYGEDVNDGEIIAEADNQTENSYTTSLSMAVQQGHKEMVQFLLENNAYISHNLLMFVKDDKHNTVWNENKDITELILRYGKKERTNDTLEKRAMLVL
jgi:hypothetical protein